MSYTSKCKVWNVRVQQHETIVKLYYTYLETLSHCSLDNDDARPLISVKKLLSNRKARSSSKLSRAPLSMEANWLWAKLRTWRPVTFLKWYLVMAVIWLPAIRRPYSLVKTLKSESRTLAMAFSPKSKVRKLCKYRRVDGTSLSWLPLKDKSSRSFEDCNKLSGM